MDEEDDEISEEEGAGVYEDEDEDEDAGVYEDEDAGV